MAKVLVVAVRPVHCNNIGSVDSNVILKAGADVCGFDVINIAHRNCERDLPWRIVSVVGRSAGVDIIDVDSIATRRFDLYAGFLSAVVNDARPRVFAFTLFTASARCERERAGH